MKVELSKEELRIIFQSMKWMTSAPDYIRKATDKSKYEDQHLIAKVDALLDIALIIPEGSDEQ